MSERVLKASGICKAYGKKQVLTNLELELREGCIYGLVGRNGAGKTTLLGVLTAQVPWQKGTVTLDGQPVWENRAALEQLCFSRELSSTLMGSSVNSLRVVDYLRAASIYYPGWDKAYAERLLREFGMEDKRKTRIHALSKGMMSMVTIVIALASRAAFTFLDEPVAGLDVVAREQFYRLLLEDHMETGRTFVVSTHILEEAGSVFERVIVLDEGRILEDAVTEELVEQFRLVTGREDEVTAACAGLTVLQTQRLGRHMACTVRGSAGQLAALAGRPVDVTALSLQKVFVALCGHGEGGAQ